MTNKNTPDYVLPVVAEMRKRWQMIDDITAGHEAIIAKGRQYLPQEPDETDRSYETRLSRAVWFDAFSKTVSGLTGVAFATPPRLGDDVPQAVAQACENIDLVGNHLNILAREWLDVAIRKGIAYVLVDMPPQDDRIRSRADELRFGIRPYAVLIDPANVINWRYSIANGQIALEQVTIVEHTTVPDGDFGTAVLERYRVLRPGAWELWEKQKDEIIKIADGTISLNYIPLVALNLDKKSGFMQARPPLYGLAHLNIAHYQIYADMRHSAHVASVPVLTMIGCDTEDVSKLTISVNRVLTASDPQAKIEWLSYDGNGVNLNRELLSDLKREMSIIGLSVLAEKAAEVTAYEKRIDTAQTQSELYSWIMALKDSVENVLQIMADYLGEGKGGTYVLNDDLLAEPMSADTMRVLSDMVAKGQLSLETMWAALRSGKRLPDEFDSRIERERIENDLIGINNANR